jgi:hypothetical protein
VNDRDPIRSVLLAFVIAVSLCTIVFYELGAR